MNTYSIKKGTSGFEKEFNTYQEADDWAKSYYGEGYIITDLGEIVIQIQPYQKLQRKKKFGEDLVFEFLLDNDLLASGMGQPTPADTAIALDEQLAPIKNLLLNGSIIQAKEKILQVIPDGVIITQERIDKYINMINKFLSI